MPSGRFSIWSSLTVAKYAANRPCETALGLRIGRQAERQ